MEELKQIDQLNSYVNRYYKSSLDNGQELNYLLKKITSLLYFLETVRSDVHSAWQDKVYELTKDGGSVNRAENEAHVSYPQMYQLRHIMTAGYRVCDAIRTNISYLKSEMSTINAN